jgi:TfoX/Sxy family transcriptional regulator of competence genes
MAWTKSSESLVNLFDEVLPDAPGVERRQMFGYPCAFVNGNMFMGLHQDNMILRLATDDREAFIATYGTELFDPMGGRPMKEYPVVPAAMFKDHALLREWIGKSLIYGSSLPKKEKKPRKKPVKQVAKKAPK